jgi:uncharacterized protein YdhG (YjbR/CyaY superfamily)
VDAPSLTIVTGRESAVDVDGYLDGAPQPQRSTLLSLRSTLRELLPDAAEALSYGMPAFVVGGKPVAGYAWAKRTAATTRTRARC